MKNLNVSENAQQAIASVNLSFSNPASSASQNDLINTFMRIESGQTSYDQEEDRLLKAWNKAKDKEQKQTAIA
ncbi:MAG: hypothetical protein ACTJGV_01940 [Proteus vulgaris]|jgi:hypothetical protein